MLGMMPDRKKMASLILDGGGEMTEAPEVLNDDSIGMEAAAEALMSALEKKDKVSLVSALRDVFTMLMAEEDMGEGEVNGSDIS